MPSSFLPASFELLDDLDQVESLETLCDRLAGYFRQYGIEHFVFCRIPKPGQDCLAPLFILQQWPQEWLDYYDNRRYVRHDPITARLVTGVRPFQWSDVRIDRHREPTAHRIMVEATDFEMCEGFSIPLFDPMGFQGCVSMAGRKLDLPLEAQRAIHMVSLFTHSTAERLYQTMETTHLMKLSPREREILRWIAVGRTQSEVSDILGIAERTVEQHLRHAREKFQTSNTTHTVVLALQRREIRL